VRCHFAYLLWLIIGACKLEKVGRLDDVKEKMRSMIVKKKFVSMLITMMFAANIVGCGADSTEDAYSVVHEGITGEQAELDATEKGSEEGSLEEQNSGDKESAGGSSAEQNTGEGIEGASKEQNTGEGTEGASKEQNTEEGTVGASNGQNVGEKESTKETTSNKNEEDKQVTQGQENATDLTFADLSKLQFEFYSGTGGWWEGFTIEKDGYFTGKFHDSNMGDTGEGYSEGSRYSSVYSGHFTDLKKIDEYTYQMRLADISYKETIDREEIVDNIRYIYTTSYCLGGNDTFTIYLPGTPLEEFSEDVRFWFSVMNPSDTELTKVAIVDEKNEYGICSYERMAPLEDAQTTYKSYKESYDYYSSLIPDAASNMEWLEYTGTMYELADDCLNYIWNLVRYNVTEEEYKVILVEQREWIAEKEAQAEEYAAEFGGSFALVAYNDTAAEMTIERCEELIEYLK